MQRVIERTEVGVDLLFHVTRQEAEPLPCFHGRAGEDNAVDLARLQHRHGLGDGQIGFAGAGGADTEDHLMARQHLHIAHLAGTSCLDGAAAGANGGQVGQRQARIGTWRIQLDGGVDIAAR